MIPNEPILDPTSALERNASAYKMIFRYETAPRWLIETQLEKAGGRNWLKQRVPGDVLVKVSAAVKFEQSFKWNAFIPHPPLAYADFGDLYKIIAQNNNWRDVFEGLFTSKEIFAGTFREIELIRNKVAHSRMLPRTRQQTGRWQNKCSKYL